ncbi:MAG TPA: HEAT repeat domain-containing protein [Geobacteraceae bacterium]|nr:HEAT repeat domain-containing protein [Geobacteraceae bacterium]
MPGSRDRKTGLPNEGDGSAQACNAALAEIHRGLKAITFYPEGHPLRKEILSRAYNSLVGLMQEAGVSLIAQRNALSFADREVPVESNPMTVALARELFAREIQQLTVLPEVTVGDFTGFLSLLATEPARIIAAGGMDTLLREQGIRSVIANEIDITTVFSKKVVGEPDEGAAAEIYASRDESDETPQFAEGGLADSLSEVEIEDLIDRMHAEADDDSYVQLANHLQVKGQALKREGGFDRLFPVLLALLEQHGDGSRSPVKRDCALAALRRLALEETAAHLLDHLADRGFKRPEDICRIFAGLGKDGAGAVIGRLAAGDDLYVRKALSDVLVRIGSPAVPQLVGLLKDGKWHIVRTAVTILGEIGSRDAVSGLAQSAYHADNRVRMEAIRSLARIGGREATLILIDLLGDKNEAVRKQVIIWLGNTKNEKALAPLLGIVKQLDILGRAADIKKEALLAIGRIGDRRALDALYRLAKKRHWFARGSRERLKLVAVETMGQLGGESSLEYLEKLSARGGRVGQACTALLEEIRQRT